nr:A disintegrin and metallopeptidase domain 3-like [Gorilla gorilla gorilla]
MPLIPSKLRGNHTLSCLKNSHFYTHISWCIYTTNQEHCMQILHFQRVIAFTKDMLQTFQNQLWHLRTCSGLRGLLQLDNISYGIEPLESSPTYEHVVYRIKNDAIGHSSFQENYPVAQYIDQSYRILVKSDINSGAMLSKRTLKIQIIMDKAMSPTLAVSLGILISILYLSSSRINVIPLH